MAKNEKYDVTVIGGGIGGYTCAVRAAQLGLTTALVEKNETLGGTCLNVGCIPSKALLSATEVLLRLREAENFGISCQKPETDLSKMMEHKDRTVEKLTGGVKELLKQNGVHVFRGEGLTRGKGTVSVRSASGEEKKIETEKLVLATGSRVKQIPQIEFNGEEIIDSTDALSLSEVPQRLCIVGAGAIGLEMASIWSRLGSRVTVVEMMDGILPGWDGQIVRTLQKELKEQGLEFRFAAALSSWKKNKSSVEVTLDIKDKGEETLQTDRILIAAGRTPYCPEQIAGDLGLSLDGAGRVEVNGRFETSVPGVYAVGDCIEGPMLAHKAEEEGYALAELLAGRAGEIDRNLVPGVVYTFPEAAGVGETEESLKGAGRNYSKGVFRFRANGKALASGHTEGFVKILADQKTDRLLGAHIVGNEAGLLIQETVSVMAFRGSAEDIARTIHAHPTLAEAVKEAAMGAYDKSLHSI